MLKDVAIRKNNFKKARKKIEKRIVRERCETD